MFNPTKKQIEFFNDKSKRVLYGFSKMKEAKTEPLSTQFDEELPSSNERIQGRIVRINEEGGWGFITSMQMKFRRIYFHWSQLDPSIDFKELVVRFNEMKQKKGGAIYVTFACSEFFDKDSGKSKGFRAYKIELV